MLKWMAEDDGSKMVIVVSSYLGGIYLFIDKG
jgi:hypothetical protein